MKTLYYTVYEELQDIDGIAESTGWKDIAVYRINYMKEGLERIINETVSIDTTSSDFIIEKLEELGYDIDNVKLEFI